VGEGAPCYFWEQRGHSTVKITNEDRAAFVADYQRLLNIQLLADKWSISYNTARRALLRFGVDCSSFLRKTYEGLGVISDAEIARRMGVSDRAVGQARRRRGIPPAPSVVTRKVPDSDRVSFLESWAACDYKTQELADSWGIGTMTAYRTLKRFGAERPPKEPPRGGERED